MTSVAELARRAASATPHELDALIAELPDDDSAVEMLARMLGDPSTAIGAGRLLRQLKAREAVPAVLPFLQAPDPLVRETAAIVLADLGEVCTEAVAHELAEGIRRLPRPVSDESSARDLVSRAQRLSHIAPLPDDVARQVADVLYFIPSGAPRAAIWPKTWISAARLLGLRNPPTELREVAAAGWPSYLSALGALALARAGIRDDVIDDWLQSTRDYYLLTAEERAQLEPLLAGLSDTALAELRAVDAP
jgi:HEAT repeat protein